MEDGDRKALEWFANLLFKAETTAGNHRAMKKPEAYKASVFNRYAAHPDLTKKVVALYEEACANDELDKVLWAGRLAARGAAMGREV